MTDEAKATTITLIESQLALLRRYRQYAVNIDHVLRWYDERKRGLSTAHEITVGLEFRRQHVNSPQYQYFQKVHVAPDSLHALLLLAKDHWLNLAAPIEAWLDARNIEHVESAKPDA